MKKTKERKCISVTIRLTPDEWNIIDEAKWDYDNSASKFIRHLINKTVVCLN